jgi:hypothetical protein
VRKYRRIHKLGGGGVKREGDGRYFDIQFLVHNTEKQKDL